MTKNYLLSLGFVAATTSFGYGAGRSFQPYSGNGKIWHKKSCYKLFKRFQQWWCQSTWKDEARAFLLRKRRQACMPENRSSHAREYNNERVSL